MKNENNRELYCGKPRLMVSQEDTKRKQNPYLSTAFGAMLATIHHRRPVCNTAHVQIDPRRGSVHSWENTYVAPIKAQLEWAVLSTCLPRRWIIDPSKKAWQCQMRTLEIAEAGHTCNRIEEWGIKNVFRFWFKSLLKKQWCSLSNTEK